MVNPPIGWRVWYFEGADAGATSQAADVVGTSSNGMAKLALVPYHGGTIRATRFVRHMSDPQLKERPDLGRKDGAWDWMPGNVYSAEPGAADPASDEPSPEEKQRAARRRALELLEKGKPIDEVAKAVKHLGLSHADVNDVAEALAKV